MIKFKIPNFLFKKTIKKCQSFIAFTVLTLIALVWLFIANKGSAPRPSGNKLNFPDCSSSDLIVDFLNVGKADCSVIHDENSIIVIDGGLKTSKLSVVDYIKDEIIKNKKNKSVNLIVLTHPHADHYGQLSNILNAFKVDWFITPKCKVDMFDHKGYEHLLNILEKKKSKNEIKFDFLQPKTHLLSGNSENKKLESKYHFKIGRIQIDILGPIKKDDKRTNNNSIVLKITFKGKKFLFTGDAEKEEERDLLNSGQDLSADVIKLGHHGSKTSSTKKFLKAVSPKYAVVSAGDHFDKIAIYPQKEVAERLNFLNIPYFVTKELGNIRFAVSSNGELKVPEISEQLEAA